MPSTGSGRVAQVNVNPRGGVPKHATPSARVAASGVIGDKQRDRRFHGGPERAVSLYSAERIAELQSEGHPIAPGSTGENLTIEGLDWGALGIGDRLRVGELLIEITGYAAPCANIAGSFADGLSKRISQKLHPGWSRLYARVLSEATVHAGDPVVLVRPG
ncbi:MAG TPA: MOSC domain-containing protein [Kouleothrix sp.]|uniref:MOSC domain-containing protein n=1 Tax=Kouleothrix sp. TaxID=2779161 RepID=UPI002B99FE73|nr:MOSC domain-containing protein [Kouleothrix sp.]